MWRGWMRSKIQKQGLAEQSRENCALERKISCLPPARLFREVWNEVKSEEAHDEGPQLWKATLLSWKWLWSEVWREETTGKSPPQCSWSQKASLWYWKLYFNIPLNQWTQHAQKEAQTNQWLEQQYGLLMSKYFHGGVWHNLIACWQNCWLVWEITFLFSKTPESRQNNSSCKMRGRLTFEGFEHLIQCLFHRLMLWVILENLGSPMASVVLAASNLASFFSSTWSDWASAPYDLHLITEVSIKAEFVLT